MKNVTIGDKEFKLIITEKKIQQAVKAVADKINTDLAGETPVFLSVLNGAFMFTSDLMKQISLPCELSFMRYSSYNGTESLGKVVELVGLGCEIKDRTVVILEDIIDSGLTIKTLLKLLELQQPKKILVCTMFFKPTKLQFNLQPDYVGMIVPDDFIIGYGLDYNEQGRNLNGVYVVSK